MLGIKHKKIKLSSFKLNYQDSSIRFEESGVKYQVSGKMANIPQSLPGLGLQFRPRLIVAFIESVTFSCSLNNETEPEIFFSES